MTYGKATTARVEVMYFFNDVENGPVVYRPSITPQSIAIHGRRPATALEDQGGSVTGFFYAPSLSWQPLLNKPNSLYRTLVI